LLQVNGSWLQMLAALHSLLVYQSLNGVYSDMYHWSVTDLGVAVDQLQAIACDLKSVDDVTQILTHVYATRCHNKHDAENIQAFIFRLIRAWAADSEVIVYHNVTYSFLSFFNLLVVFLFKSVFVIHKRVNHSG